MTRIGINIDEQDGCNNLGVRCRIEPCLVAIGVPVRCPLERSGRSDLETQNGADDLMIGAPEEGFSGVSGVGAVFPFFNIGLGGTPDTLLSQEFEFIF